MRRAEFKVSFLALFASSIVATGCTGTLGFPGGEEEGTTNSPGDSAAPDAECAAGAPELEGRLLTSRQYEHTILDLFGLGAAEAAEEPRAGSAVSYSLARVDEVGAEEFDSRAEDLAQVISANLAAHFPCASDVATNDPCVTSWIDGLGLRIYRRPLTTEESSELHALFGAGYAEGGPKTAVDWLLSGMLQAPDFLYRLALTRPDQDGETGPVSPHELATRLSYFLWDSLPDSELFALANEGDLTQEDALRSQVERMMNDPKFERMLRVFYNHWLGMGAFAEVSRDVWSEGGVDIGEQIIASLRGSVAETVNALYKQEHPTLRDLLSSTEYLMDPTLAEFYGASTPSSELEGPEPCPTPDAPEPVSPEPTPCPDAKAGGFVKVDLGAEGRRGILTHPALMTAMARPNATFPIARGLFVVEQLLCQHLEVPEAIDIPPLGPVPAGGTERDQLELHNADPVCASCHSIIDPPGFSFQSFDEVGRVRTIPEGDDTGIMTGSGDLDGAFANGTELFERIAESQTVRACFAQHFFEFALSRPAEVKGQHAADQCSLERIQQTFGESGDLKALITQVVLSQPFRNRLHSLAKDGQ